LNIGNRTSVVVFGKPDKRVDGRWHIGDHPPNPCEPGVGTELVAFQYQYTIYPKHRSMSDQFNECLLEAAARPANCPQRAVLGTITS